VRQRAAERERIAGVYEAALAGQPGISFQRVRAGACDA